MYKLFYECKSAVDVDHDDTTIESVLRADVEQIKNIVNGGALPQTWDIGCTHISTVWMEQILNNQKKVYVTYLIKYC